jgi:diguanylate cyclase (GGDEF)-like protein
MLQISALKKGIFFAFIFALVILGGFYYTTNSNLAKTNEQIQELLPKSIVIDSGTVTNQSALEQTAEVLNIANLEIKDNNNNSIYSFTTGITTPSYLQMLFPTSKQTFEANNVSFAYDLNLINQVLPFGILAVLGVVLLFVAVFITSAIGISKAKNAINVCRQAIVEKRFEDIPFAELSNELKATNDDLNQKLDAALNKIEQLEIASSLDELTGLYNRTVFKVAYEETFKKVSSSKTNLLGIIRASEILTLNSERGYVMGDKYIKNVAEIIKNALSKYPGTNAYRISGGDFAILIPNATEEDVKNIGEIIKSESDVTQKTQELTTICYCGFTLYKTTDSPEKVMSRADLALARAQTGPANGLIIQNEDSDEYLQGEIHWRQTVVDIINRRSITLYYQPIRSLNISITPYVEIFARFTTKEGDFISTENVLAAAHRHDLSVRLEEMIIENIIQKYQQINNRNVRFGINLSANALISTSFLLWLERTLLRHMDIAPNLVFEINENLLESNPVGAERLFSIITRSGASTSISHFGNGIESFKIFRELKPNYIKLDPNLCQNFEKDLPSQQFVRMIIEVSHRLGCVVIAEGVESNQQRLQLETLYVDAMQGYLIAKPVELIDEIDLSKTRTFARDLSQTFNG